MLHMEFRIKMVICTQNSTVQYYGFIALLTNYLLYPWLEWTRPIDPSLASYRSWSLLTPKNKKIQRIPIIIILVKRRNDLIKYIPILIIHLSLLHWTPYLTVGLLHSWLHSWLQFRSPVCILGQTPNVLSVYTR